MFRFKQFEVQQDQCAMKVGTDGVLLGSWVNCETATSILDIGTGTGLIALMLAQRNKNAIITGVEIDHAAALQAQSNCKQSIWDNRLIIKNIPIQEIARKRSKKFDLIVSNPPFFELTRFQTNLTRKQARQEQTLTLSDLVSNAFDLLASHGCFALIFPSEREQYLIEVARQYGFFVHRKRYVKGSNQSPIKRVLIEFYLGKGQQTIVEPVLIIEPTKRHEYSTDYRSLTKEFYLKF